MQSKLVLTSVRQIFHIFFYKISQSTKGYAMFSRISKHVFQHLLLFISRVYYANEIAKKLIQGQDNKAFSFENFPVLKEIFECLELCLEELGQQKKKVSSQSATQLLHGLMTG
jgi:hypothetical protein